ncbi:MAG: hypothetical protein ACUVRC_06175 [Desulfotomaculales bacterium]
MVTVHLLHAKDAPVKDICLQLTPRVEAAGPAETFVALPPAERAFLLARLDREGIRISGGAGENPLVARAATLAGLKRGRCPGLIVERHAAGVIFCVAQGAAAAFMASLPLAFLWPLPARVRAALARLGFATVGEVARVPSHVLRARFGIAGDLIALYSRGRDPRRVAGTAPPAQLAWRFCREGMAPAQLTAALALAARELADRLRRDGRGYRQVVLRLDSRREILVTPGAAPGARRLRLHLELLLARLCPAAPVDEVEVLVRGLYPLQARQLDLFGQAAGGEARAAHALEAVEAVYPGRVFRAAELARGRRREEMLGFYDPWRLSPSVNV